MDCDSISDGCKAFTDGNFNRALEIFSNLLEENDKFEKAYSCRAEVNIKLRKFEDAKSDAKKSIENGASGAKAYLSLGTACFSLKQFKEAEEAFKNGKERSDDKETFDYWLEKCHLELESSLPKDIQPKTVKKDWYQTETDVVMSVMIKNLKSEDVSLKIEPDLVTVDAKLPNSEECSLIYNLAHSVVPEKSTWKVLRTKLEIKLRKETGGRWTNLETVAPTKDSNNSDQKSVCAPAYPTSSATKKDWNEIGKEINKIVDDDKAEGDAALNELFQKIYKDGDENLRRAMNKSFMESGGTVLSTNWSEVGSKEIEMKPPEGMEFKKWS